MTTEKSNYEFNREQSSTRITSIIVVFSSFLVYIINGGVFFSSGIFYPEFLESGVGGKVAISWLGSLQTSVCLFSGKRLWGVCCAPLQLYRATSCTIDLVVYMEYAENGCFLSVIMVMERIFCKVGLQRTYSDGAQGHRCIV